MDKKDKIYIAGHTGLIGYSLVSKLKNLGYKNLLVSSSQQLDLVNQNSTEEFFKKERPDYVFMVAGKSGGIVVNNNRPVDFIYPNVMMEFNVINASFKYKVKKLLFMACGCVYPRDCPQPIKEEYLLLSKPEPTNITHTVAKLAGIVLCQSFNKQYGTNFISVVSSNVFGPNDNFSSDSGHVIPSLLNRFHQAKIKNSPSVTIWGSGNVRRDFIYVDDVADACVFLMEKYNSSELINIGAGIDISIKELSFIIKEVVGFKGELVFDTTKPDGMPKKLLDTTRILKLGWKPKFNLKDSLKLTYDWFLKSQNK